jgi:hypothetical protein
MIARELYAPIFYNLVLVLTLITAFKVYAGDEGTVSEELKTRGELQAWILSSILILFLGLRPVSGIYFGDTSNYAKVYEIMKTNPYFDWKTGDVLFNGVMYLCAQVMPVEGFFLIIETIYIVCAVIALNRFFPQNVWAAFIAYIGAFSFYSYGINGIRHGAAAAVFLLGISFLDKKWPAFLLMLLSVAFHKSMMVPFCAILLSLWYKNSKGYMIIWLLTIPVSLISGGFFENLFANLGFDERLTYLSADVNESLFSHTGFRWDFLLYSCVPIMIGYYAIYKKNITSAYYTFLLNTYVVTNAFWILVIRANYSNRFAYLSWFLYPVVLLYPFIHFDIWDNRHNKTALALSLHYAFTYGMWLI